MKIFSTCYANLRNSDAASLDTLEPRFLLQCDPFLFNGPAQEILDAGAQDFIQKPFSVTALSEKLKEVLEGKS